MLNLENFIKRSRKKHGDKYDYSKVIYTKATDKVTIICPEHGEFQQEARAHYRGQGCPICGIIKRSQSKSLTTQDFINRANEIHSNKYDYSKVNYVNENSIITITCPEHGEFLQVAKNHLSGNGCPQCGNKFKGINKKLSLKEFVDRSNVIHDNKYDYSLSEYVNSSTPLKIICPKHGIFLQAPNVHMYGHGCPKCANDSKKSDFTINIQSSKESHVDINDIYNFISSIVGEDNIIRNDRSVLNGYELDIYIPSKKIAFEFDGLYWHSEIKKPSPNYHLDKTNKCEEKGIHLIHIFEDEWIYKKDICKSRIENLLGVTKISIGARKCKVIEVPSNKSKEFFDKNHIQGNVNSKVVLGLEYNGEIISMMSFGYTRKNMGRNAIEGEWELLRFCNKLGYTVIGGASKLFKHFIKIYNPNKIISYADRRWSIGNLYDKIGLSFIHNSKPNYFYVFGDKRKNRFSFRKDLLISKYGCSPDDTEHNFCFNNGWYRIYDCGTKLYEWKKAAN